MPIGVRPQKATDEARMGLWLFDSRSGEKQKAEKEHNCEKRSALVTVCVKKPRDGESVCRSTHLLSLVDLDRNGNKGSCCFFEVGAALLAGLLAT